MDENQEYQEFRRKRLTGLEFWSLFFPDVFNPIVKEEKTNIDAENAQIIADLENQLVYWMEQHNTDNAMKAAWLEVLRRFFLALQSLTPAGAIAAELLFKADELKMDPATAGIGEAAETFSYLVRLILPDEAGMESTYARVEMKELAKLLKEGKLQNIIRFDPARACRLTCA